MLRFRPDSQAAPSGMRGVSRRERIRLWLLVIALGLVLLAMRRIGQPRAQQHLQRWLGLEVTTGQNAKSGQWRVGDEMSKAVSALDRTRTVLTTKPRVSSESKSLPDPQDDTARLDQQLREVQDNTSFRPQEQAAWFALLGRLQQSSPSTLQQQSIGLLSYAQLLGQPDVYRGQVVTLHGTVLREEQLQASANAVGIGGYHRLILQPAGGGEWPFVVYTLQLPENFPEGDSLRAQIEVTGFFFKNWSYSWGDGLGLAPVVLANNVRWLQSTSQNGRHGSDRKPWTGDWKRLALAVLAAALFAGLVLVVVWKQTGRQRPRVLEHAAGRAEQSIQDTLRQLSEYESHE